MYSGTLETRVVYFRPQLSSHVVLVTYNFRYLASAPGVRWRARAGALALGQEPKLLPQLAHTTTSSLGEGERRGGSWEVEGGEGVSIGISVALNKGPVRVSIGFQ